MRLPQRWDVRSHDGVNLSLLDWGGEGPVLLGLHGHFGQGLIYQFLAEALASQWRVLALDQRGHGFSGHARRYARSDYVADAGAALDAVGVARAVVLGSSLGGVNAYQMAARHPQRVSALIIEDIGAVCQDDLSWCRAWPQRFPSLAAMQAAVPPYFCESAVQFPDGWGFRFDRDGIIASGRSLNGDWWADWLASRCPALLMRGGRSNILSAELAAEMVARRPGTMFHCAPEAGHNINEFDPRGYAATVSDFLTILEEP